MQPLWKTGWRFLWRVLRTLKVELPYDLAIRLLSIYPDKTISKRYMHPLFITVVFTIAKTGKQPNCPSTDKKIKKTWCTYTVEY